MVPAARLSAAIEVMADLDARRRPAADALKDWGLSHRFAGSGDRAAIAGLAYDALRRKASAAFLMQDASARANLIGMLPGAFLYVYLGATARQALTGGSKSVSTLIGLGATIAVVMVVTRAARKAMTQIEVESRATAGLNASEAQ